MDKPRLIAVLVGLQAIFPKHLSEDAYEAYYDALQSFSIENIEGAGRSFLRNGERFPLPVHFRQELSGTTPPLNTSFVQFTPQQYEDWNERIANHKGSWFDRYKKARYE